MSDRLSPLGERRLRTVYGEFVEHVYFDGTRELIALVTGDLKDRVLTRVHSHCVSGQALLSVECDCREQFDMAMQRIGETGSGVVVVLDQDARGFGHSTQVRVSALMQHTGVDQNAAYRQVAGSEDGRDFSTAAEVLKSLGVRTVMLMTNNPKKVESLVQSGIDVERVPLIPAVLSSPSLEQVANDKRQTGHQI